MNYLKSCLRILADSVIALLVILLALPISTHSGVFDEEGTFEESFPYTETFTITAYYSPLPCQAKYVTGSYDGDIRLNGSGVNSADGTPVYPGMVAAPKSFPFGTKMHIPGIGFVAVHDRGGAIVNAGQRNGVNHDRLDIWMGYGDKGLKRALNWGKRNVDVTVYGITDSIIEEIYLDNYSSSEAIPSCGTAENDALGGPEKSDELILVQPQIIQAEPDQPQEDLFEENLNIDSSPSLESDLLPGDSGDHVLALQSELKKLNFYKQELSGEYDDLTEHAVFKFQQSQLLVGNLDSPGAGIFGPKTRDRMNEIISSRNFSNVMVAAASTEYQKEMGIYLADSGDNENTLEKDTDSSASKKILIANELDYGLTDPEVRKLQEFLREKGFFPGLITSNYYGDQTLKAVLDFQMANQIISSPEDFGAGRVGPKTLQVINSIS